MIKRIITRLINKLYKKSPLSIEEQWRQRGVDIGEGCDIHESTILGSEPYLIHIGNHVRTTYGVKFITHDGGLWVVRKMGHMSNAEQIDRFGKIRVGNNVHIGIDAIIMPGVSIGNNVIIGCGSVVTKDIPDNSVAVGIPAHVIEDIDTYVAKHLDEFDYTKQLSVLDKEKYLREKFNIEEKVN